MTNPAFVLKLEMLVTIVVLVGKAEQIRTTSVWHFEVRLPQCIDEKNKCGNQEEDSDRVSEIKGRNL